ncbi:MAG TPA: histidine kinase dimerization/phospho-acceptor domain-containing protein [Parafilimonas sp.]|nr:histidine kinase dimerization/phospho-acceptor domain-containing protein [Parafilimonas sp.]
MKKILWLLLLFAFNKTLGQKAIESKDKTSNSEAADSVLFWANYGKGFHYEENQRDSALYYYSRCEQIAQQNDYPLELAFVLAEKGYVLMKLDSPAEALQSFLKANQIAENPNNESAKRTILFTASGHQMRLYVLVQIHKFWGILISGVNTDETKQHFSKAIEIAGEVKDTVDIGIVSMNLADLYLRTNEKDSALLLAKKAESIFNSIGDLRLLGFILNTLGNIYLRKNENDSALYFYYRAIQSSSQGNNLSALNYTYTTLTQFYLSKENYDSSFFYARKNLTVLQSMNDGDLGDAHQLLAQCFQLKNNTDSAYKYQSLALVELDTAFDKQFRNLTAFEKVSFSEQLRLQQLEEEKALTQNKIELYSAIAALAVLIVIGIIIYRNYRQRTKANKVLESTLSNLKSTQAQLIQSEKMASLGELTAGIAHEIQNPLNFVNNFSEVSNELVDEMKEELNKGDIDEAKFIADDIKQNLEKINHHGRRADSIVKNMLQHSKQTKGVKEPTDINALCDEYLRLAYHGLRAKDKNFNAEIKNQF